MYSYMYIDAEFLKSKNYIWDKSILVQIFKIFENLKNDPAKEFSEKSFMDLKAEITYAVRKFLNKLSELPLISKCRVKGDSEEFFGGKECAYFAKDIRAACEKYIKETAYKEESDGSIFRLISDIRNKAKNEEAEAFNIEKELKNIYLETGKDNSIAYIQKCGYNFNNLNFIDNIKNDKTIDDKIINV